jgi:hypothetical protein
VVGVALAAKHAVKQMRNGFAQDGFDRARRVAQLALRLLDRQGARPHRDANAFGRTGRRPVR